jgi:hypothetical protein
MFKSPTEKKRRQSMQHLLGLLNQSVRPTTRNERYPDRFKLGKWLSKELLSLFRAKVKALTP